MTEQPTPNRGWGAFGFGLIIGCGIGAVIGILKAPRSGEATLAQIALQIQQQIQRDAAQEAIEEGKAVALELQAERKTAAAPEEPTAESDEQAG